MTRPARFVLLALILGATWPPAAACAQDEPAAPGWPHLYISLDGTLRAIYTGNQQTLSYEEFAEQATFTATFNEQRKPTYGGTVGVRIWGALGAGVSVTRVQATTDATVTGSIPHPFFFDQFRTVSGAIPSTTREELAIHGQVRVYIPIRSKFDVVMFGGPSRWQVKQTLLERVTYSQSYPYDTAELTGADVETARTSAWGYNGGVDVSAYVTHNIGVGGLIEIATANLPLRRPDNTVNDANVGGLRFGAGLRLRF